MANEVNIRPLAVADQQPVRALLQQSWAHDPKMLVIYGRHRVWPPASPRVQKTLVASQAGEIRGVATLLETVLHPHLLWAAINVAPDWQRRGIGSALYDALAALGDGRPWFVQLTLRDQAGTAFLTKRGFYNPRSRSIMGTLEPQKQAVREWLERLPREVPGYTFLALDDSSNRATLADVARVHAAVYRQYHGWNPPIEEATDAALAHYCSADVLAGSHLCVFEETTLIGAANLFRSPIKGERGIAYLAHIGIVGADRPHVRELTAALIRRSLEWASAAGMRVRFEADEWYSPHREVYLSAPADDIDRDFAAFVNA